MHNQERGLAGYRLSTLFLLVTTLCIALAWLCREMEWRKHAETLTRCKSYEEVFRLRLTPKFDDTSHVYVWYFPHGRDATLGHAAKPASRASLVSKRQSSGRSVSDMAPRKIERQANGQLMYTVKWKYVGTTEKGDYFEFQIETSETISPVVVSCCFDGNVLSVHSDRLVDVTIQPPGLEVGHASR